jgi:hypothetical protein
MKPRLLIFTLLLSLSMATTAWARLGETESAVITRYGKPAYKMHRPWGDQEGFSMNGFSISVTFINGVSRGEVFTSSGHTITVEQASDFLSANCEGYSWDERPKSDIPKNTYPPIKQMWQRPNGSTAVLTDSSFEFKSIFLIIAQEDAAKQKPAAPSTQGF